MNNTKKYKAGCTPGLVISVPASRPVNAMIVTGLVMVNKKVVVHNLSSDGAITVMVCVVGLRLIVVIPK